MRKNRDQEKPIFSNRGNCVSLDHVQPNGLPRGRMEKFQVKEAKYCQLVLTSVNYFNENKVVYLPFVDKRNCAAFF